MMSEEVGSHVTRGVSLGRSHKQQEQSHENLLVSFPANIIGDTQTSQIPPSSHGDEEYQHTVQRSHTAALQVSIQ